MLFDSLNRIESIGVVDPLPFAANELINIVRIDFAHDQNGGVWILFLKYDAAWELTESTAL